MPRFDLVLEGHPRARPLGGHELIPYLPERVFISAHDLPAFEMREVGRGVRRVVYAVEGGLSVLKAAAQADSHDAEVLLSRRSQLQKLFPSVIGLCAARLTGMSWQRRELHFITAERARPLSEYLEGADDAVRGRIFTAPVGAIAVCCAHAVRPVDCKRMEPWHRAGAACLLSRGQFQIRGQGDRLPGRARAPQLLVRLSKLRGTK